MIKFNTPALAIAVISILSSSLVLGRFDERLESSRHNGNGIQNTFEIDYENDIFLMNGSPFRYNELFLTMRIEIYSSKSKVPISNLLSSDRYISGSIHYFRVPEGLWLDRLTKIRAAGFKAIQFVIPWNLHQRFSGNGADFSGDNQCYLRLHEYTNMVIILITFDIYCCQYLN